MVNVSVDSLTYVDGEQMKILSPNLGTNDKDAIIVE